MASKTMARPRPQWQFQALAAQRRDNELRRAEELKKVADYFESNTNKSRYHEQWTTESYYERANKEAEMLNKAKIKAAKLEERRKKLELMLFQENMQYQSEMQTLAKQPKLFKNGSYLNNVSTTTLQAVNQGIKDKEEELRRHEAELRLHHAWRLRQPEIRAAESFVNNGKLKSAWMEQIVEKEIQKKKEEEETRKSLIERDEMLQQQIELEEQKLREKEMKMQELRSGLEDQISELNEKEVIVKHLRTQEEKERLVLDELKFISNEREKELSRLMAERDGSLMNMGLHKYKLKRKVQSVLREIQLDIEMMEKIRLAVLKDYESDKDKLAHHKRVLDTALSELEECRSREQQRQKNIESMYDGEARQINEKQDKLWALEREARASLMRDVVSTLRRQVEEKIEASRQRQRENVLERERILEQVDSFHQEVRARERDQQVKSASQSAIAELQSQLSALRLQQRRLEAAAEREAAARAQLDHERRLRTEIARTQRRGSAHAWT